MIFANFIAYKQEIIPIPMKEKDRPIKYVRLVEMLSVEMLPMSSSRNNSTLCVIGRK